MHAHFQAEEASAAEAWRKAEVAKLGRERRVVEQQSKAILKVSGRTLGMA